MKMKRIMKSTRGEGYIDLAVAVLVLVFVLVIANLSVVGNHPEAGYAVYV